MPSFGQRLKAMVSGSRLRVYLETSDDSDRRVCETFDRVDSNKALFFGAAKEGEGRPREVRDRVSKKDARLQAQNDVAAKRRAEKELHARMRDDPQGALVPSKHKDEGDRFGFHGTSGQNCSSGYSRRVKLRRGDKQAARARKTAEAGAARETALEDKRALKIAADDRLAAAITLHETEALVAPDLRGKLHKLVGDKLLLPVPDHHPGTADGAAIVARRAAAQEAVSANPNCRAARKELAMSKMKRRLSMATVTRIVMMGQKGRRRAKNEKRARARELRERHEKEGLVRVALDEQRKAEATRGAVVARHAAARERMEQAKRNDRLREALFARGDFELASHIAKGWVVAAADGSAPGWVLAHPLPDTAPDNYALPTPVKRKRTKGGSGKLPALLLPPDGIRETSLSTPRRGKGAR